MKIAVILEAAEDGGFTASIPTLPGCVSEGDSIEEALGNIREAFTLLIEATDDDLIVGERDRVEILELDWLPTGSPRPSDRSDVAAPSEDPGPSMASASRAGRLIESD